MLRLYVITRADLPPGAQAVQACHAVRQFAAEHPAVDAPWYAASRTLALLAVADEGALHDLARRASERGVPCALVREPDLADAATSLALGPSGRALCRGLPLTLAPGPRGANVETPGGFVDHDRTP